MIIHHQNGNFIIGFTYHEKTILLLLDCRCSIVSNYDHYQVFSINYKTFICIISNICINIYAYAMKYYNAII